MDDERSPEEEPDEKEPAREEPDEGEREGEQREDDEPAEQRSSDGRGPHGIREDASEAPVKPQSAKEPRAEPQTDEHENERDGERAPRSALVTAAGAALIVSGLLGIVGGWKLFGVVATSGVIFALLGMLLIVVGVAEIYAGVRVVRGAEAGRNLGRGSAVAAAILSVPGLYKATLTSAIAIPLDIFVYVVLRAKEEEFEEDELQA